MLQRLSSSLPNPPPPADIGIVTYAVVTHALWLLKSIHAAAVSAPPQTADKLVNATDSRTITYLLDLIVLEGIYPSLSPGVGIPIERRAMRFATPNKQKFGQTKNVELLGKVVEGLISVMEQGGVERGVGEAAKERCLVDVLAGCGELAFVQNWHTQEKRKWDEEWNILVNRSV